MKPVDARKVVIYVTGPRGLLVFDEPDHPDVALQVPGGTVEPGETFAEAALRELVEETGLAPAHPLEPLGESIHAFPHGGRILRHHRAWFHLRVDDAPAEWIHAELTPDGGGPPIRFRLHWITVEAAAVRLGYGFGERLPALTARINP